MTRYLKNRWRDSADSAMKKTVPASEAEATTSELRGGSQTRLARVSANGVDGVLSGGLWGRNGPLINCVLPLSVGGLLG